MAEINIERKSKKKPVWPWILGLLLLAGIIWAIADSSSDPVSEEVAVVEEPAENQVATEPQSNVLENHASEVNDFVSYVESTEVKDKMGIDHVVTSEALIRLTGAMETLAMDDYSQEINEIRQTATEIQSDPQSLQHADKVNNAFSKSANVLKQIQENRFPETAQSEVEDLQEQARNLEDGEQLLNQKDEVKSFFEKAADAVEQMDEEKTI